jgi:hypothetical protein
MEQNQEGKQHNQRMKRLEKKAVQRLDVAVNPPGLRNKIVLPV